MNKKLIVCSLALLLSYSVLQAEEQPVPLKKKRDYSMHHNMQMDMNGMVMNSNTDQLPAGCSEISEDIDITVKAGRKHASKANGIMFAYDQEQWKVKPCARMNVTFVNDDRIRHQFMLHGLPPSIYPPFGMFNIEVTGPGQRTASFILPKKNKTYLVHCDVAQHMENGMKAQIVVGEGDEKDLFSIPGLTPPAIADQYNLQWDSMSYSITALAAIGSALLGFLAVFGYKKLVTSSARK